MLNIIKTAPTFIICMLASIALGITNIFVSYIEISVALVFVLVLTFIFSIKILFKLAASKIIEENEILTKNAKNILDQKLRIKTSHVNYLEKVLYSSMDPIFTTDQENRIFKYNKGAEKLFGYTQEDIVGVKVFDLVFENEQKEIFVNAIKHRESGNFEIKFICKDESLKDVEISFSEIDDNGWLEGSVLACKDLTETKKVERKILDRTDALERLSRTDDLTGLFNRRQFNDEYDKMHKEFTEDTEECLSMILMDLDKFKDLNDTHGHQKGDEALQQFSDAVKKCIRLDNDPVYRYGGDEFIILLPNTQLKGAKAVAKRLQTTYNELKKAPNNTTISFGLATSRLKENAEDFFKRADAQMYKVKKQGGNNILG